MRFVWVIVVAACTSAKPQENVDPVTVEQATEAAQQFLAAAQPCVESQLAELIDHDALGARLAARSNGASSLLVQKITHDNFAGHLVCQWQAKAVSYKFLHVHTVHGQPRPVFRRVAKSSRTGVQMVAYDELLLGASRKDHRVRVIDIYSYVTGQTLSELLSGSTNATHESIEDGAGPMDIVAGVQKAKQLRAAGQFAEALAALDGLPPALRHSRGVLVMRMGIANSLSKEAYKQALDEIAAAFPDDPAMASVLIDGDVMREDYDAALRHIDVLDRAIGGDPWQDAVRTGILVKRNHPGDLERAAECAENVVRSEPKMSKGYFALLDVQLARKQFTEALTTMTRLADSFSAKWDDAKLRASPPFAELVATPEYAAWRASRESRLLRKDEVH